MIYIKALTIEERAVWGTCPVCGARQGRPCKLTAGIQISPNNEFGEFGTHPARLYNAPKTAAIEDKAGVKANG